jgi:integrase
MHDDIRVRVVEISSKRHFQVQWNDSDELRPDGTPKIHTRSTGVERRLGKRGRDEAQRVAERLQTELNANSGRTAGKVRWAAFRERYESEHACVPNLRKATVAQIETILDRFERELNPQFLRDISGATLSKYAQRLRQATLAEATIKKHVAHLVAAFHWAKSVGLMRDIPARPATPNARRSLGEKPKGRPLPLEEFERFSKAVATVKKCKGNASRTQEIQRIMEGLLFSGLRIEELMALSWESDASVVAVFSATEIPVISWNSPDAQKNHSVNDIPMTEEFAELLAAVPAEKRSGFVFAANGRRGRLTTPSVGRFIAAAGEAAGIKVGWNERTQKPKYASAHDLRRSFGEYYKDRVSMNELRILMRHKSITTTARFYLGSEAQALGRKLRAREPREILGWSARASVREA